MSAMNESSNNTTINPPSFKSVGSRSMRHAGAMPPIWYHFQYS
jgi:hypothetical protein